MDQLLAMRVFIRITDARSLAKAADSLNLPRSSVSKLLQDLEQHLGTKLIERSTRSFTITPMGERYREQTREILAQLDEMDTAARYAKVNPQGKLRVDVGSSLANEIIIPALPEFHARYPQLELLLGVNDRPADLIGEGVDCVIRGGVLPDSSMIGRQLCTLDYVTCATSGYLSAHGTPVHPQDIKDNHQTVRYFFPHSGKSLPLQFSNGTDEFEIHGNTVVNISESTALTEALLTGMGIGQIFRFSAEHHFLSGRLIPLLEEWKQPSLPVQLVYPANRHQSAKLRAFVDWALELFAREFASP